MKNDFFTLEAINAKHGDALLLHYGTKKKPRLLLMDGGPTGVYRKYVKPRLTDLATSRGETPLVLDHVMVSHLDNDHIKGVLDLAKAMFDGTAPATTGSFWVNVFKDVIKELPPELAAAYEEGVLPKRTAQSAAVLASVGEGQALRDAIAKLKVTFNGATLGMGHPPLLIADKKALKLPLSPYLTVRLVSPNKELLRKLAADWKKKAKPKGSETAAYVDTSVYNLSSLVMVVEATDQTGAKFSMLLTGDARGDHVLAGLESAKLLKGGGAHFNLLKVAHHGSDRNYEKEFFQAISADHYVISADGRHENPSKPVLEWIAESAGKRNYRVYMTNKDKTGFPMLEKNIAAAVKKHKGLKDKLEFRAADELSVKVDLMKKVTD